MEHYMVLFTYNIYSGEIIMEKFGIAVLFGFACYCTFNALIKIKNNKPDNTYNIYTSILWGAVLLGILNT